MVSHSALRILIDTNVFIAAESDAEPRHPNGALASKLYSLAGELNHTLCVGDGIKRDFERHADAGHRLRRSWQLERYHVLRPIAVPADFRARAGYPPNINDQSKVDLTLLLALERNAAQWLVTEDQRILPHAKALGLEDRVFSLNDVIEVLQRQQAKPISVPAVEEVRGYELNRDDPIFDEFFDGYSIRDWIKNKVAAEGRLCFTMGLSGEPLDAVVILNHETEEPWGLEGEVLKVCTFKVAAHARGIKRGELLLWAVFSHARENAYDSIFVEVFEHELELIALFESFGFDDLGVTTTREGELVYAKHLSPVGEDSLAPLDYNVAYGPGALKIDRLFLIPILPRWHKSLFPVADDDVQLSLVQGMTDQGNAIRKAYVCKSPSKQLRPGDTVLFLRTRTHQMVNVVGVVEETLRSSDPAGVLGFTGRRTVYSPTEINDMCSGGEVLAIRFRLDRVLSAPLTANELVGAGVMKRSPMSIQRITDEGASEWLRTLLTA